MLDFVLRSFYYALTSSGKFSFINLSRSFDTAKLSVQIGLETELWSGWRDLSSVY